MSTRTCSQHSDITHLTKIIHCQTKLRPGAKRTSSACWPNASPRIPNQNQETKVWQAVRPGAMHKTSLRQKAKILHLKTKLKDQIRKSKWKKRTKKWHRHFWNNSNQCQYREWRMCLKSRSSVLILLKDTNSSPMSGHHQLSNRQWLRNLRSHPNNNERHY